MGHQQKKEGNGIMGKRIFITAMMALLILGVHFNSKKQRQVEILLSWDYKETQRTNPNFWLMPIAVGGDIINPGCDNPYRFQCRTDITPDCAFGYCSFMLNITTGKLYHVWFFHNWQVYASPIFMSIDGRSSRLNTREKKSADNKSWSQALIKIENDL